MGKYKDLNWEAIGRNIRDLRRKARYSQNELAEELQTSVMTISRMERGTSPINTQHLVWLSKVLNVEMGQILNLDQEDERNS